MLFYELVFEITNSRSNLLGQLLVVPVEDASITRITRTDPWLYTG